ncbi:MAG: SDR family oxidoreductase [Chlorobi bacterium]|nr:SDR family oxidoreductase [Chlorobiota bacterium]
MNILVTGASRGIGYETVKKFASNDKHKIIAVSRNKSKLDELANNCRSLYPDSQVIPIAFDLSGNNYKPLLKQIDTYIGSLDILINNAGLLINRLFSETNIEEARRVFDVNFFAPAQLIRNLLPLLKKGTNSHIINISSMGGFQGSMKFAGLAYYSSSKAAISSLTECLSLEFKNENISVNCLALGAVQTEMLKEAFPGYKAPVKPDEMAQFIFDFAINGNKYFNGKILPVSLSTP